MTMTYTKEIKEKTPLHFFWLIDSSGSMYGEKMATVNFCMHSTTEKMAEAAKQHPSTQLLLRILRFSTGASWTTDAPTPIEKFAWKNLEPDGVTDVGAAFSLLTEQMECLSIDENEISPTVVLLSDGFPSDEYRQALDRLLALPIMQKATRIAISVGKDTDHQLLTEFTGSQGFILQANNAAMLTRTIQWAAERLPNPCQTKDDDTPTQQQEQEAPSPSVAEPVAKSPAEKTPVLKQLTDKLDMVRFKELVDKQTIPAYREACQALLKRNLPDELQSSYGELAERLDVLEESVHKFEMIYSADISQFCEYYIPETMKLTVTYLEYLDAKVGEKIVSETRTEVMQAIKKLLLSVNEKIDDIYKFASIETKAQARALETLMSQDGYIDETYKIK